MSEPVWTGPTILKYLGLPKMSAPLGWWCRGERFPRELDVEREEKQRQTRPRKSWLGRPALISAQQFIRGGDERTIQNITIDKSFNE